MLKARPDRKNPLASSGAMPATMIGSRSADRIRAAVICAANAVHMSAPAEKQHAKKTLATGEPSTHEVQAADIARPLIYPSIFEKSEIWSVSARI